MPVDFQSPFRTFQPAVHPRYGVTQSAATNGSFAAALASTRAAPAGTNAPANPGEMVTGAGTPAAEEEGGPDPSFMDPRERTIAFTRPDWKPQADSKNFHPFGDDGLTFDDVIDVVNPLQHIPVVSTVYRWLTGDTISPAAELAGGALYGGAIGFAASAGMIAVDGLTGGAADQQFMVSLLGPSPLADDTDNMAAAPAPTPEATAAAIDPAAAPTPASDAGMPTSRGAGLATAALAEAASASSDPAPALQEIPADLVDTLSKLPNAVHDQGASSVTPAASVPPPASSQPQIIGAGSVSDSLPVVMPQTAAASSRVTEAPSLTAPSGAATLNPPARALKPLPAPLPAGFTIHNPPPIDTGGLGRSMPAKLTPAGSQPVATGPVDPATVPAAMTRALDSYRKMMQERNRDAVPVPGLDFQS
ncbi:hypothetical protein [Hypericibacter sp.]|uniref:hypothetical protein n=1 Tax=Hypericibacter sp. TaxID=2705401 RepID=UPI003D6D2F27